jgi:transcriptional regulator with XRE-family HTH domain
MVFSKGAQTMREGKPQALVGLGFGIRKLREGQGWSQARLASEAHVSASNLSNYEQEKQYPSTVTLGKILDALGGDLSDLCGAMDLLAERPGAQEMSEMLASVIARLESRVRYLEERLGELPVEQGDGAVAAAPERRI